MNKQDRKQTKSPIWRARSKISSIPDRMPAVRIAVIYGVVSGLWIIVSDHFINLLTDDPELLSTLQTYKGLFFIVVTTIGLYGLVLAQTRSIRVRQQRADEQARLQNDIASLGRTVLEATSLDEIYSQVLQQVAESLSADLTKLARVEGTNQKAKIVEGIGWQAGDIEDIEVPVGPDYLAGRVLEARRPIIVERLVQADDFKIPQFLLEEGAVSSMVAPIRNEEPLGVLGVHHKSFRRFTQYEANYLQAAANLLGQAILNFKSKVGVELRSELLDSIGQAVLATDREGEIFYWNKAAERMYGWPRDEVIGRSVLDLTPALGQDQRAAEIMKQMQGGQPWQGEFRLRRKDGTEFVALVQNSPLRDEQGDVKAIIGVTTDISEINETKRELQKATARLNLLHQVDQHILNGTTMEKMSQAVLEALEQQIHFGSSLVLEYEKGGDRVRKLASINNPTSFKDGNWLPMKFIGMPGQLDLPPDPFIYFPDTEQVASSNSVYEEWLDAGQRSLLVARMRVEDKPYGAIVLSRTEVDAFSQDEIELLNSVADSLAVGLHGAQLREAERKRALELESLQRISINLISELKLDDLLQGTVRSAYELLNADDGYLFLYDEADDELTFSAGWTSHGLMEQSRHQPRDDGITIRVARSGQRAEFRQVADHELFSIDFPDWRGSLVSQPIAYRGEVLGVLTLSFLESQLFSPDELLVVELLADLAAVAIHNTRQYEDLQRRRAESETLFRVTQRLAGEYQLQDVLDAIAYSVCDVIEGAEASSIWLAQEDSEMLEAQAWHGHEDRVMSGLLIPRGHSVVGKVIDDKLPIRIDDASGSALFEPVEQLELDRIKSLIGVPIWVGQVVIGALFADSFDRIEAFNQRDFRMLELLSNQAATAIRRARLFDQIQIGRERLMKLSRQLVQVQEEERKNLARELHDEIGQLLTGLKLTLEMADEETEGSIEAFDQAIEMTGELLRQVRDLSLTLRPSMLDDLGLLPTLVWQAERAGEQLGLDVSLSLDDLEDKRLSSDIETTVYRVVQESLTNVARHAGSDHVWVSSWMDDNLLNVQVQDEGVGFSVESTLKTSSAKGLSGMRERALLLNGRLAIESAPGEGTTVTLTLPLEG